MTGTAVDTEALNRANDKAIEELLKRLRKVGNEHRALEDALADKREERNALMVEVAATKLIPKELIYVSCGAARTTMFNALKEARREDLL